MPWRGSPRAASIRAGSCWLVQSCPMKPFGMVVPISSSWSPPRSGPNDSMSTGRAAMHSRSSATTEVPGMSPSTWRPVDISSIAPTAHGGLAPSANGSSRAIPYAASEPREIDASLYLFALCRQLQTIYLARRGIDCLLDADGAGRLPEAACRMLGSMVCELVQDASTRSQPETARRTVSVTLRRRGTTCLCTISGQGRTDSYEYA